MATFDEKKLLDKILADSAEILQASRGNVAIVNQKPSLEFIFEPGKCEMLWKPGTYNILENEEAVQVIIDVHEKSVLETLFPHLKFTTYFPFTLQKDILTYHFLLKILNITIKESPFVEPGIVFNKNNDAFLSFCCNRLMIHDINVVSPEVSFYIKLILTSYEFALMVYESLINNPPRTF